MRLFYPDRVAKTLYHPFVSTPSPIGLAHRGGGREAPQNSLTAFRNAADIGLRVFRNRCSRNLRWQVMVFHDANLNRVTDRVGRISACPTQRSGGRRLGAVIAF